MSASKRFVAAPLAVWLHALMLVQIAPAQIPPPDDLPGPTPWVPADVAAAPPFDQPYFDLDLYLQTETALPVAAGDDWRWQLLPTGMVYKSYLSGSKESRMGTQVFRQGDAGTLWDATLGARVGLVRFGTTGPLNPQGFQIDAEGSAQLRLDLPEEMDVTSADFRAGVPFTFRHGRHQTKLAYYHLSSHVGDEFLLKNPEFTRINYSRDALVFGHAIYLTDWMRIYAEAGWGFDCDVCEPWEFQFGLDWAPLWPTGLRGAPFFAVNGHLREELDFGGGFAAQAGWAWRSAWTGGLLRTGLHYYHGKSTQFSFYDSHEEQIGAGLWYDF